VFAATQPDIDSRTIQGLQSDGVLAHVRPGLEALGYRVESGKEKRHRIARPVLFGDQGRPRVNYEVDAVLDSEGVLLEVEAGRAMMGNAVYRDLVRTSLIVGARYLALCVMSEYKYNSAGSSGVRKELGELLRWFHEPEGLAGSVVEAAGEAR
jgi:hypothetical protein